MRTGPRAGAGPRPSRGRAGVGSPARHTLNPSSRPLLAGRGSYSMSVAGPLPLNRDIRVNSSRYSVVVPLVRSLPGPVWRLSLDRPEARNAVSGPMLEELGTALGDATADPDARVVLLSGEGTDFCAGADLDELAAAAEGPGGLDYGRALEEILRAIADHPLPVVAVIHGAALGAGCQIAVACDLALASVDATMGIPSARLGIVIGYENIERLVLSVGPKRAADILVAGRTLSGQEAAEWGLVNEAVPGDLLTERGTTLAERIAEAAPLSVRGSKRGIRAALAGLSLDREAEGYRVADVDMMAANAFASEDLREGIRAFRERRRPDFRGK
jgi:enoyl-CoA hydratase